MVSFFSIYYAAILISNCFALPQLGSILKSLKPGTFHRFRARDPASVIFDKRGTDPYASGTVITVNTLSGPVNGKATSSGYRFTVRYAQAPVGSRRFADPVPTGTWIAAFDGTALPNACPQDEYYNPSVPSTNEDCLFLTVYVPKSVTFPRPTNGSKIPVFVWLHGGSFASGGISLPGLDGTALAQKGVVVVVVQYRLGMLGFLRSSSIGLQGNYGTKDVQLALQWVAANVQAFGGGSITLAGQSSGASMVKTQLTVPSSDTLFSQFISHSGPIDFPDQTPAIGDIVGGMSLTAVGCSTLECLRSKSVSDIITAQNDVMTNGHSTNPAISVGQVYSPVVDGTFVKQDFQKALNGLNGGLTKKDRKGIFTNVANEECALIENSISSEPLADYYFDYLVPYFMAPPQMRSDNILASSKYDPATVAAYSTNNDACRAALDDLGTDYNFRCIGQQAVTNLTATGQGTFYIAQFNVGIPYPNAGSAYCDSKVAHQDDIPLLFASGPVYASTTAQNLVSTEVVKRWIAFIKTGNPNASGYVTWNPVVNANSLSMLLIGGSTGSGTSEVVQSYRSEVCKPSYWGRADYVPFDSQIYT